MQGFRDQIAFLSQLKNSVNDLYAIDDTFTLIEIEVRFESNEFSQKDILNFLSNQINKAIINDNDCYSFFGDKFYILTYIDNKKIIKSFINSLASTLDINYDGQIYLNVGYVQYPYEIIDVRDVFGKLRENTFKISPDKSSYDAGLVTDKEYNQVLSKEITKYLNLLQNYSEILYKHCISVTRICANIAEAIEIPKEGIKKIIIAAILHDIGYLEVPQHIFNNPSQSNLKSIALLKMHPILATRKILKNKTIFVDIFPIIEQHHEYIDGSGYPFGLQLKELSLETQIISLADTYDFLKLQGNIKNEEIINFFVARAGIRWDERLITIFTGILSDKTQLEKMNNTNYNAFF